MTCHLSTSFTCAYLAGALQKSLPARLFMPRGLHNVVSMQHVWMAAVQHSCCLLNKLWHAQLDRRLHNCCRQHGRQRLREYLQMTQT